MESFAHEDVNQVWIFAQLQQRVRISRNDS